MTYWLFLFKVNAELKKLLVASLGEDLNERFDCLVQSKARLAHEVSSSSHRLGNLYEQLEKLSIQCDVWRSKFLASRYKFFIFNNIVSYFCKKFALNSMWTIWTFMICVSPCADVTDRLTLNLLNDIIDRRARSYLISIS